MSRISTPFARANSFMAAMAAALASGVSLTAALADLGAYRSRGHGRGTISGKKKGNHCTNWKAHMNSERECARRRRQIAKGMLKVSAGGAA